MIVLCDIMHNVNCKSNYILDVYGYVHIFWVYLLNVSYNSDFELVRGREITSKGS